MRSPATASQFGTYPAGETVNLGNYYQSQALAVEGAEVPKAYVYIDQL